jgi:hypothetical protein
MIFLAFGQFISILGGSLFQILVPCGFFGYFWLRKEWFASSVMLFWIADNIINVSVYMKDASEMKLPLPVAGSIHDWNWIFGYLGLLSSAKLIGTVFFSFGAFLSILSIVAMVYFTLADTVKSK